MPHKCPYVYVGTGLIGGWVLTSIRCALEAGHKGEHSPVPQSANAEEPQPAKDNSEERQRISELCDQLIWLKERVESIDSAICAIARKLK